jgi:ABC-type phosphate transport system substrate-binding protein
MWVYVSLSRAAYNLDRITRLIVEEVGSRAAIKAEIDGKTIMLAFYDSPIEAQVALENVLSKQESGASVVRL